MEKMVFVLFAILFSGLATVTGLFASGYKSDFGIFGVIVFIFGALVLPPMVAVVTAVINGFLRRRKLSTGAALMLGGPLLGLAVGSFGYGYMVDSVRAPGEEQRRYSQMLMADPGIGLRERWFVRDPALRWDSGPAMRQRVFENSLNQRLPGVQYTPEQLGEVFKDVPKFRMAAAAHPNCPPELIADIWQEAMSPEYFMEAARIIGNPATPMNLIESYEKQRLESNRPVTGPVDKAVRDRLNKLGPGKTSSH